MRQPGRDSDGRAVVSCTSAPDPEGRPCPLQGPSTPVSEETSSSRVSGTTGTLEAGAPESHSWKTKLRREGVSAPQIVDGVSLELWTCPSGLGHPRKVMATANSQCVKYALTFSLSAMSWSDFLK